MTDWGDFDFQRSSEDGGSYISTPGASSGHPSPSKSEIQRDSLLHETRSTSASTSPKFSQFESIFDQKKAITSENFVGESDRGSISLQDNVNVQVLNDNIDTSKFFEEPVVSPEHRDTDSNVQLYSSEGYDMMESLNLQDLPPPFSPTLEKPQQQDKLASHLSKKGSRDQLDHNISAAFPKSSDMDIFFATPTQVIPGSCHKEAEREENFVEESKSRSDIFLSRIHKDSESQSVPVFLPKQSFVNVSSDQSKDRVRELLGRIQRNLANTKIASSDIASKDMGVPVIKKSTNMKGVCEPIDLSKKNIFSNMDVSIREASQDSSEILSEDKSVTLQELSESMIKEDLDSFSSPSFQSHKDLSSTGYPPIAGTNISDFPAKSIGVEKSPGSSEIESPVILLNESNNFEFKKKHQELHTDFAESMTGPNSKSNKEKAFISSPVLENEHSENYHAPNSDFTRMNIESSGSASELAVSLVRPLIAFSPASGGYCYTIPRLRKRYTKSLMSSQLGRNVLNSGSQRFATQVGQSTQVMDVYEPDDLILVQNFLNSIDPTDSSIQTPSPSLSLPAKNLWGEQDISLSFLKSFLQFPNDLFISLKQYCGSESETSLIEHWLFGAPANRPRNPMELISKSLPDLFSFYKSLLSAFLDQDDRVYSYLSSERFSNNSEHGQVSSRRLLWKCLLNMLMLDHREHTSFVIEDAIASGPSEWLSMLHDLVCHAASSKIFSQDEDLSVSEVSGKNGSTLHQLYLLLVEQSIHPHDQTSKNSASPLFTFCRKHIPALAILFSMLSNPSPIICENDKILIGNDLASQFMNCNAKNSTAASPDRMKLFSVLPTFVLDDYLPNLVKEFGQKENIYQNLVLYYIYLLIGDMPRAMSALIDQPKICIAYWQDIFAITVSLYPPPHYSLSLKNICSENSTSLLSPSEIDSSQKGGNKIDVQQSSILYGYLQDRYEIHGMPYLASIYGLLGNCIKIPNITGTRFSLPVHDINRVTDNRKGLDGNLQASTQKFYAVDWTKWDDILFYLTSRILTDVALTLPIKHEHNIALSSEWKDQSGYLDTIRLAYYYWEWTGSGSRILAILSDYKPSPYDKLLGNRDDLDGIEPVAKSDDNIERVKNISIRNPIDIAWLDQIKHYLFRWQEYQERQNLLRRYQKKFAHGVAAEQGTSSIHQSGSGTFLPLSGIHSFHTRSSSDGKPDHVERSMAEMSLDDRPYSNDAESEESLLEEDYFDALDDPTNIALKVKQQQQQLLLQQQFDREKKLTTGDSIQPVEGTMPNAEISSDLITTKFSPESLILGTPSFSSQTHLDSTPLNLATIGSTTTIPSVLSEESQKLISLKEKQLPNPLNATVERGGTFFDISQQQRLFPYHDSQPDHRHQVVSSHPSTFPQNYHHLGSHSLENAMPGSDSRIGQYPDIDFTSQFAAKSHQQRISEAISDSSVQSSFTHDSFHKTPQPTNPSPNMNLLDKSPNLIEKSDAFIGSSNFQTAKESTSTVAKNANLPAGSVFSKLASLFSTSPFSGSGSSNSVQTVGTTSSGKVIYKAKLGEEMSLVYDKELKRYVKPNLTEEERNAILQEGKIKAPPLASNMPSQDDRSSYSGGNYQPILQHPQTQQQQSFLLPFGSNVEINKQQLDARSIPSTSSPARFGQNIVAGHPVDGLYPSDHSIGYALNQPTVPFGHDRSESGSASNYLAQTDSTIPSMRGQSNAAPFLESTLSSTSGPSNYAMNEQPVPVSSVNIPLSDQIGLSATSAMVSDVFDSGFPGKRPPLRKKYVDPFHLAG